MLLVLEGDKSYKKLMGAIHTSRTEEAYRKELDKFIKHERVKTYDDLLKLDDPSQKLADYLAELKADNYSWSSRNLAKSALVKYYDQNRIYLDKKFITGHLGKKSYLNLDAPYSREEIQQMIKYAGNIRNVAIILFAAVTGIRIQAFDGLRIGHLKNVEGGMFRVDVYAETDQPYFTFTTPECTNAINDYLSLRRRQHEKVDVNSPLWRTEYDLSEPNKKVKGMKSGSVKSELRKIRYRSNIAQKKNKYKRGQKFESSTRVVMGFRKFYANSLLEAGVSVECREWMMGHSLPEPISNYIKSQYHQDRNLKEFMKAVDLLTISNEKRNEQLLAKQSNDIKIQLAQEQLRVQQLENQIKKQREGFREEMQAFKNAVRGTLKDVLTKGVKKTLKDIEKEK